MSLDHEVLRFSNVAWRLQTINDARRSRTSRVIRGSKGSTIQDLPIGGIDTEGCECRGNPYVEESDASEWDEDSSRDKSPVMSRNAVLVTYRGTTAIVKYREFDPVARPFLRSITFVEIFPPCIETCGIDPRLLDQYVIDDDCYIARN